MMRRFRIDVFHECGKKGFTSMSNSSRTMLERRLKWETCHENGTLFRI